MIRSIVAGIASLSAVGAATYFGLSSSHLGVPMFGERGVIQAEAQFCLKNDIRLFHGVDAGCYTKSEFDDFRDAQVLNASGETVTVMLTHPDDMNAEGAACTTCREYQSMRTEGWYALSSRAMRREAFFERACGVLDAIEKAQIAEFNYFADGSPTIDEMRNISISVRNSANEPGQTVDGPETVEKLEGAVWRLKQGAYTLMLEEILNADFDNDGVAEILAFLVNVPDGGTARFVQMALIEKDLADGPVKLSKFPPDAAADDKM
ncbi:MAG: hypothetical protein HKN14_16610 [Marinicaulis sp.]|nr:hypothetical protein [Marinicaulis sp.]NNE42530.1 hypothetical protein [Marinicaulis sp.]